MNLMDNWKKIMEIFDAAGRSSLHVSVATVDAGGNPHIAPIGSLILGDDGTGYYFEEFPQQLPENLETNKRITVLAVNSDPAFWMEALSGGKFSTYPGMRLMGTASPIRVATPAEIDAWHQRVSFAEGLKGHDIMWKDMKMVRDVAFDSCKPVFCGEMTAHLV